MPALASARGMEFAAFDGMIKTAGGVLWDALQGMFEDDAFPLAGALAYYSLLSMAPLLLVAVALAGVFFADGQVHMQLIEQMRRLIGEEGAALTRNRHREHRQRGAQRVVARDRRAADAARREHRVRPASIRAEPRLARQGRAARRARS